jgi:hypothetical protein
MAQMYIELQKRIAEMSCRNRAKFGTDRRYREKWQRCRIICRRNADKGIEVVRKQYKARRREHGYDGLARLIPVAEVARLIRFYPPDPPDSRSILNLQKNGRDAKPVQKTFAETVQYPLQYLMQMLVQNFVQYAVQMSVQMLLQKPAQ